MTPPGGGQAMGELGRYFPGGFRAKTADDYLDRLRREQFSETDIYEGAQRVIATRTQRTFPSYAEIRNHTSAAQGSRVTNRIDKNAAAPWLSDPRVGSGRCDCGHGLGVHGPEQGGYGEPMLTGNCRQCPCARYHSHAREDPR